MDRQLDVLERIWQRYVGYVTPSEFMILEPDSDIDKAVRRYVQSMRDDFTDIEDYADDIAEYIHRYMELVHDAVLEKL